MTPEQKLEAALQLASGVVVESVIKWTHTPYPGEVDEHPNTWLIDELEDVQDKPVVIMVSETAPRLYRFVDNRLYSVLGLSIKDLLSTRVASQIQSTWHNTEGWYVDSPAQGLMYIGSSWSDAVVPLLLTFGWARIYKPRHRGFRSYSEWKQSEVRLTQTYV